MSGTRNGTTVMGWRKAGWTAVGALVCAAVPAFRAGGLSGRDAEGSSRNGRR